MKWKCKENDNYDDDDDDSYRNISDGSVQGECW